MELSREMPLSRKHKKIYKKKKEGEKERKREREGERVILSETPGL